MSNKYPGGFVSLGGQVPSYSVVFDGSGDSVSAPNNSTLALSSGDFSVEWWMMPLDDGTSSGRAIVSQETTGGMFWYILSGTLNVRIYAVSTPITYALTNYIGVWTHIAVTRESGTLRLFVNGVLVSSASNVYTYTQAGTYLGGSPAQALWFNGYLSNFRVVTGTAIYTSSFVPPTAPLKNITGTVLLACQSSTIIDNSTANGGSNWTLTANGNAAVSSLQPPFAAYNPNNLNPALGAATPGVWTLDQALNAEVTRSWPMYDPYYRNVVLNLHGNGANGAQNNTFLDSSSNAFTITRNGNTTQGTFSPYGPSWSNYFDGSGDSLQAPSGASISGTGDFTAECWIFPTAVPATYGIIATNDTSAGITLFGINANGTIFMGRALIDVQATSTNAATFNAWNHIALSRSSGTLKIFVNGVQGFSGTVSTSYNAGIVRIGTDGGGSSLPYTGYISNFRSVAGTAVYTSNFTPSSTPLTAISGTSLLTCQSNRFVDASTNAYTITVNGDTKVQRFQPFLFNTSYTPATIGGSGYFDGTGDYLSIPTNTAFAFGTGDFTIEMWALLNSADTQQGLVASDTTGVGYWAILIYGDTLYWQSQNGATNLLSYSYIGYYDKWTHISIVRSSGTTKLYLNGVQVASAADSTNYTMTAGNVDIGRDNDNTAYMTGYLSNLRILKGVAAYTGAFTPPSLIPLSTTCANSIASYSSTTNVNTSSTTSASLLCNFTNAGIFDNAMMNDLETVGNAQVSTSVKKYGTGSLKFDGVGDYLSTPVSPQASLPGDFTIEFWAYLNDQDAQDFLGTATWAYYIGASKSGWSVSYVNGLIGFSYQSNNTYVFANNFTGTALSNGVWNHIAIVRSGGVIKCYLNGVASSTTITSSTNFVSTTYGVWVGCAGNGNAYTYELNGYLDDVRITNGVARYTANFTPPTSQLQDQ